jgi:hypothetical protein
MGHGTTTVIWAGLGLVHVGLKIPERRFECWHLIVVCSALGRDVSLAIGSLHLNAPMFVLASGAPDQLDGLD